jgi:hypothetical protein
MKRHYRYWTTLLGVVVLLLNLTSGIQAQAVGERAPGISTGFNLGLAWLNDNDLGTGLSGRAFVEYAPYIHEVALKLSLGFLYFKNDVTIGQGAFSATANNVEFSDLYLTGGLIYRLSRGNIVPFLTGNLGVYFYNQEEVLPVVGPIIEGQQVSSQYTIKTREGSDFGMNLGGGLEFFVSRRSSISVEMLVHFLFGEIDDQVLDLSAMFRFFPKK